MEDRAKIIAFCGIDGCGKSTQLKLVKDNLSKSCKVMVAKLDYFPLNKMGDNKYLDMILKGYSGLRIIDYYKRLQSKDVFNYDYILCDRHLLCYLAYAYAYGIGHLDLIRKLFFMVKNPDLTFYFDVPVDEALRRISGRSFKDRNENFKTLTLAKEGYKFMIDSFDNVFMVDGTLASDECLSLVIDKVKSLKK